MTRPTWCHLLDPSDELAALAQLMDEHVIVSDFEHELEVDVCLYIPDRTAPIILLNLRDMVTNQLYS